ncbi:hypothetical protein jhhlp_006010 [Lomentospora prolificans]|uniref:Uncharacterized protein n=1 Tax=Lomentospora prolificans TaxID=41688 RepID=A0A2N3N4Q3_9PEZI|nr:hypothetical protein jhhlp_006010 [Lomentospora prolificans]
MDKGEASQRHDLPYTDTNDRLDHSHHSTALDDGGASKAGAHDGRPAARKNLQSNHYLAAACTSQSSQSYFSFAPLTTGPLSTELTYSPSFRQTSEPRPEMSRLRGGGLSLGFDCCGGSCRFYKHCC